MIKLEKYTGTKNYLAPSGKLMTPEEVYKKAPAAASFTFVVETDANGEVMFAFDSLSTLRTVYNIDSSLGEDEAIAAIENLRNNPPEPLIHQPTEPTPEERSAAALEAIADGQTTENKNALDILLGEE